jgi:membrane fusion protein (multidrug efflux system)
MRLDAYPWTQFGMVAAQVGSVANEPRDGKFRVEFKVQPQQAPTFFMQHGLTGTVEVEVDRVSPASLVLQTVSELVQSSKKTMTDGG